MKNMLNGWTSQDEREMERRSLRRDAAFIGTGMLLQTLLMQFFFTIVVMFLLMLGVVRPEAVQSDPYMGLGNTAYMLIYAFVYTVAMGSPMLLASLIFHTRLNPFGAHKRVSVATAVFSIPIGMTMCVTANFAANSIVNFLYVFGIAPPDYPEMLEPTPLSLILNLFVVAVLPAVLEEMVYRGFILQTLRRYGDGLAILVSAILFGLMHGNILQIPFAFLIGLVMGFMVVQTGNIWMAVALHFTNNAIAVLLDYAVLNQSVEQANQLILLVYGGCALVGLLALIPAVLLRSPLLRSLSPSRSPLSPRERESTLLTSPPFLISVVLYILLTCANVQFVS